MKFTVIIPAYNAEDTIERAKASVPESAELIVANDPEQYGPGWARNQGLDMATGDWIVFLDADDELAPNALTELKDHIEAIGELDLVDYGPNGKHVYLPKDELLRRYLRLRLDGSVVYTAFRKSFLDKHNLRFADGFHEDIDFMFKAYKYAHGISSINEELYLKSNQRFSIVNTMSKRHIDGWVRAWHEIGKEIDPSMELDHKCGFASVVATRVRAIHEIHGNGPEAKELYEYLYSHKV
jgi:glycosyltransferase involved in cell wall biosynthesis